MEFLTPIYPRVLCGSDRNTIHHHDTPRTIVVGIGSNVTAIPLVVRFLAAHLSSPKPFQRVPRSAILAWLPRSRLGCSASETTDIDTRTCQRARVSTHQVASDSLLEQESTPRTSIVPKLRSVSFTRTSAPIGIAKDRARLDARIVHESLCEQLLEVAFSSMVIGNRRI